MYTLAQGCHFAAFKNAAFAAFLTLLPYFLLLPHFAAFLLLADESEKWAAIFRNSGFIHIKRIVCMLLSIFSSNAYCESVFSVVKNVKTDERNRMKLKLLNSRCQLKWIVILIVKKHIIFLFLIPICSIRLKPVKNMQNKAL